MRRLLECPGGEVVLPDSLLIDRRDGGHLIVNPARAVWERSELTFCELTMFSALVAATGWAMLTSLPQLDGGCVNYWEAGNWSLHDEAVPRGPKRPREHRRVHLHVIARSRSAMSASWRWGEAPSFPRYVDRTRWAAGFEPLEPAECARVAERIRERLADTYRVESSSVVG